MGGATAIDWDSMTVCGVYGTYRFRLPDASPYINEALYAHEMERAVYVYAEHGTVVEVRVINPDREEG